MREGDSDSDADAEGDSVLLTTSSFGHQQLRYQTLSGYLVKRGRETGAGCGARAGRSRACAGGNVKTWRRRFFSLKADTLAYFRK